MVIVFAACGRSTPHVATTGIVKDVAISNFEFRPMQIRIGVGGTVRWTNDDRFLHTITSGDVSGAVNKADGHFDKQLPKRGATAAVTFTKAGTFTYFCRQHNVMSGTVVVT
jgi:plastocyanin